MRSHMYESDGKKDKFALIKKGATMALQGKKQSPILTSLYAHDAKKNTKSIGDIGFYHRDQMGDKILDKF